MSSRRSVRFAGSEDARALSTAYIDTVVLRPANKDSRAATKPDNSSAPVVRQCRPSQSPGDSRPNGNQQPSGTNSQPDAKRTPAAGTGDTQQQKTAAGTRRANQRPPQNHQQPSSRRDDVIADKDNDKPAAALQDPQRHRQAAPGDEVPAEKKTTTEASSANDEDEQGSEKPPDGAVVTKNGYIRVFRVVGK